MARKFRPTATLPGLAVLLIALVILVRSLAARNAYEIILSSAALALWMLLRFTGAWAVRRLAALEALWKPSLTAGSEESWLVTCQAPRLPLFFRLHYLVRGRFFPQGTRSPETGFRKKREGCAVFAETSLPQGGDTASLSLRFPLGGLFQGEGFCRLRDVFGFFSFPCGHPAKQTLKIRSASCTAKPLRIDALSGAEDRRNKTSSNEERYYMREYAPGDRFRDINWKSSGKIDTLITRISPDNQEKITRIEVCFRNFGPNRPGIGELWLLDRAKARLAWFLRSVKEEKASFVFHVSTAGASWELKDQEEIDAFLEDLSALPFSPAQNENVSSAEAEGTGEIYVFSTACDTGLPAYLLARQGRPLSLFVTQNLPPGGKAKDAKAAGSEDCACLRLRDFPSGGSVPRAGWFFKRQQRAPGTKNTRGPGTGGSAGRTMIDYAEIRL